MPINFVQFRSFDFIENCPSQEVILNPNTYLFEAWGASGGGSIGGSGGYTAGILQLNEITTFYVFVGGEGGEAQKNNAIIPGGCNGGGNGGAGAKYANPLTIFMSGSGGGGATDIRLNQSNLAFNDRILVAGGGGGSCDDNELIGRGFGGHAGGVIGLDSTGKYNISEGGKQQQNNGFGIGQSGRNGNSLYTQGGEGNGGGGGGWFGGYSYQGSGDYSNAGGGGGSSYISGNNQCKPHPSFVFTKTVLKSGNESFLSPEGIMNPCGHRGNGFFRISLLVVSPTSDIIQLYHFRLIISIMIVTESYK